MDMPNDGRPFVISIADAHDQIASSPPTDEARKKAIELVELIVQDYESLDEEKTEPDIAGSPDDYHNLATELSRRNFAIQALTVVNLGNILYPCDIDLLADVIKYSTESANLETGERAYQNLCALPPERWNWRAFTFSCDFLRARLSNLPDGDAWNSVFDEAVSLARRFQKSTLFDERAYVAEAEILQEKNDYDAMIEVLVRGISRLRVTPQCCMKLADIYLKRGQYKKVIEYASIGIRGAAQEQPTVTTGYLYYISALSRDALIHEEALECPHESGRGFLDQNAVGLALMDYRIAATLLQRRREYTQTIKSRVLILKAKADLLDTETEDE